MCIIQLGIKKMDMYDACSKKYSEPTATTVEAVVKTTIAAHVL